MELETAAPGALNLRRSAIRRVAVRPMTVSRATLESDNRTTRRPRTNQYAIVPVGTRKMTWLLRHGHGPRVRAMHCGPMACEISRFERASRKHAHRRLQPHSPSSSWSPPSCSHCTAAKRRSCWISPVVSRTSRFQPSSDVTRASEWSGR
eukprot:6970786-Prymnesium_polylepis.1